MVEHSFALPDLGQVYYAPYFFRISLLVRSEDSSVLPRRWFIFVPLTLVQAVHLSSLPLGVALPIAVPSIRIRPSVSLSLQHTADRIIASCLTQLRRKDNIPFLILQMHFFKVLKLYFCALQKIAKHYQTFARKYGVLLHQ